MSTDDQPIEWRQTFRTAVAGLPDEVTVPYERTPEGERLARFRRVCDEEFMQRIDRAQLSDPAAFDAVAGWDGTFPGPLAVGGTGAAKTRAAWSALGRLMVKEGRGFAWFPAKRLIAELARYEKANIADEFWRYYGAHNFPILFVDDVDKINWQFESEAAALFQFYDWIYRKKRACITTTNRDEAWWTKGMGEAFVRRMFRDAHRPVRFK